jgi:OFA family oxalate/formate antiporter-like MFS transporter
LNAPTASVDRRPLAALAAATALNVPYGTIYAFSVFLRPMEQQLGVSRTEMSVVFAAATVTLAIGMNLVPVLARRVTGGSLLLLGGALGALGVSLVTFAEGFWLLMIGYGLMFGLGGGLTFTALQQGVNQSMPRPSGLANGYVVSLYPVGAMIGAPIFSFTIPAFGVDVTLWILAATLLSAGLVGAWLFRSAGVVLVSRAVTSAPERVSLGHPVFLRLFFVFFLAASAGMMVLSQAAGMLHAYGASGALAAGATTFITGAIAATRLGGGWLVDRIPMRRVAVGANVCALVGAALITWFPSPLTAALALAMLGMGYGLMSGASAGYLPQIWSRDLFASTAARLYIAWCAAALALPVLAGWLYDATGGYQTAILVAACGNLAGAWLARGLPQSSNPAQK